MARTKTDSFKRTVKFYDENFDLKEKTVEGKIVSAKTKNEAEALFGNDDVKIKDALNQVLRETQIAAAMNTATGGMEERFIMGYIKPQRSVAPFHTIEDEKEQTAAILEQVKKIPFLLEGLKSYCLIRSQEGNDSEE